MVVLSYIIKIRHLRLGQFRSGLDIWNALLNKSNLFMAIKNATLGLVIPEHLIYLNVCSLPSFKLSMSLSEVPACGDACFILLIIADNLFLWDLCFCLSPLSLEMESCSKCFLHLEVVPLPLNSFSFLSWYSVLLWLLLYCQCRGLFMPRNS